MLRVVLVVHIQELRSYMREKMIEQKLCAAVRKSGGIAMKLVSPGLAGVPDRLLLFPGGKIAFCEVKAPGQKPRPLQEHRIAQLRALGFKVYVVDSVDQIQLLLIDLFSKESAAEGVQGAIGKPPGIPEAERKLYEICST